MNLKECYEKFSCDFDGVMGRLRREQLVEKFLYKFLDDKSYELYGNAMSKKDYAQALRAVHTLKGVCQNLSSNRLYESSNQITTALKVNDYSKAIELSPQLSEDYYQIVHATEEYKNAVDVAGKQK